MEGKEFYKMFSELAITIVKDSKSLRKKLTNARLLEKVKMCPYKYMFGLDWDKKKKCQDCAANQKEMFEACGDKNKIWGINLKRNEQ